MFLMENNYFLSKLLKISCLLKQENKFFLWLIIGWISKKLKYIFIKFLDSSSLNLFKSSLSLYISIYLNHKKSIAIESSKS